MAQIEIFLRIVHEDDRVELIAFAQVLRRARVIEGEIRIDWRDRDERLGPLPEAIAIAVTTGGAITVAIREIVRALARRTNLDLKMSMTPTGPVVELKAEQLSHKSTADLNSVIDHLAALARAAAEAGASPGPAEASPTPEDHDSAEAAT